MFFIARMTAAMLIWFCGSNSTTWTFDSTDSAIGDLDLEVGGGRNPVAAEIDEFAGRATEHELSAAPLAIGRHVVHDDAEMHGRGGVGRNARERDRGAD